jgi:8-oxo-dGTP pyrophosphatase MutT (NUDIX family)
MDRQYRHSGDIISIEIPGVVIDGEEKPVDAAKRELLEETGYLFEDFELVSTIYPNPATSNNITYCYLAKGGKKVQEQDLDEHEDIDIEFYTIPEVKEMLLKNEIPQALHVTGLMYGLLKLGELR